MICASRETVTRLFAEFKRKQIVSLADNAIFVRDRKALESWLAAEQYCSRVHMCVNAQTAFLPLLESKLIRTFADRHCAQS